MYAKQMVNKTSIEADKFPRMQRASLSPIFVVIPPVSKNNSGVNPNLKLPAPKPNSEKIKT